MRNRKQTGRATERGRCSAFRVAVISSLTALLVWHGPAAAQERTPDGRYTPDKTIDDYSRAAAESDDFDYSNQSLRVSVWLDREEDSVYRRGDRQTVGFQTNEDAYAVVYRIDTVGLVTVLWPRSRMDDGFIFGGHEYRLPGRDAPDLEVGDSEGEGYVQAIVSRYPFDLRALELDFQQGHDAVRHHFMVAGDPFLAMNEVNYAVTGLEDSGDQVVTNYARYYVHRQVEHPRYLCGQCHTQETAAYDPYRGNCALTISYDYGWGNDWYTSYGYYPVYWNPVYVYIDPWTRRPWVNFWYEPYYVCAPSRGWHGAYWGSYAWYDSPYYGGGCGSHWDAGGRRYQPLNRHAERDALVKGHEYAAVSRQVSQKKPDSAQREAMRNRASIASRAEMVGGRGTTVPGSGVLTTARGAKPLSRPQVRYEGTSEVRSSAGLRIRDASRGNGRTDVARDTKGVPARRHTSAGAGSGARLDAVRGGDSGSAAPTRRPGASAGSRDSAGPADQGERKNIRALNPRQRGSRSWNSNDSRDNRQPADRSDRPARARPQGRDNSGDTPATRPSTPRSDGRGVRRPTQDSREQVAPPARPANPGHSPREVAPAPKEAEPVRRSEPARSRTTDDREDAKAPDAGARRSSGNSRK